MDEFGLRGSADECRIHWNPALLVVISSRMLVYDVHQTPVRCMGWLAMLVLKIRQTVHLLRGFQQEHSADGPPHADRLRSRARSSPPRVLVAETGTNVHRRPPVRRWRQNIGDSFGFAGHGPRRQRAAPITPMVPHMELFRGPVPQLFTSSRPEIFRVRLYNHNSTAANAITPFTSADVPSLPGKIANGSSLPVPATNPAKTTP